MATYKGVGYDSTNARVRTGTNTDAIAFDSQINALDSLAVTGTATVSSDLTVSGNASVVGNLDVQGDIISRGTVNLVVEDNFIDLNFANSTATSESGGLTIQMNRNASFTASTVTTFVAGVAGVSNPTFTNTDATGSSPLVANDIVVISGAEEASNDGLYSVSAVSGATFPQTVTIKGIGTVPTIGSTPFVQNQFTAATGQTATAFCTDIAVWAVADGSVNFKDAGSGTYDKGTFITSYQTDAQDTDFAADGGYTTASSTLQSAYEGGNEITTAANDIAFTLANGDFAVGTESTGGMFSVAGDGVFSIATTNVTSGSTISHQGAAGADLLVQCTAGSLNLKGGEAIATAVVLEANHANGGIDINAGTLGIAIDATGASNFTTTGGALTLTGATASTWSTSAGALTLDGAAGVTIVGNAGEVDVTTTGALDLNSAAGTWDSTAGIALTAATASSYTTAAGALTLTAAAASTWSTGAGALTLDGAAGVTIAGNAGEVDVTTTGALDLNSAVGTWDSTAGIALTAATASSWTTAAGDLTLNGADTLDLDGVYVTIDATKTIIATAVEKIELTSTADEIELNGLGIDINATTGAVTVDAATTLSLDALDDTNLTMTANSGVLKTMTIAVTNSGAGNAVLDIDATNEIQIDSADITMVATGGIVIASFTVAAATALTAGNVLYLANDSGVPKASKADANAIATCRVVGIALASVVLGANVNVVTHGVMELTADAVVGAALIGTPVYASATTPGLVTTDTSAYATGDVVYQIGHILVADGGADVTVALQPVFVMEIG